MAIDVVSERAYCYMCGQAYEKLRGAFHVSYAKSHRGVGYMPVCKTCVETLYTNYMAQCGDQKSAIRQLCRKLDLYWSENLFEQAEARGTPRTILQNYIQRTNARAYANKSYDDTLIEEGSLWKFSPCADVGTYAGSCGDGSGSCMDECGASSDAKRCAPKASDETIAYWGSGYTDEMYEALENRLAYWKSKYPDGYEFDAGTESLLQQICGMELDITRDRADGKSVDKSVSTLNSLLGSLNLKPVQRNQDDGDVSLAKVPLGVWLYRYENKRPLPDDKSDNKILKYVFTWFGHVCKMLGVKNGYSQMYEDEIKKYRVDMPEYDGDDDEAMMAGWFNSDASEEVQKDESL